MNDLISRSALKEDIESLSVMVTGLRSGKGVLSEYAKHYKESVVKLIDEAPTVEAKPVVYGEWIEHFDTKEYLGSLMSEYECSICHEWVDDDSNFCPRCGADMRGGKND